MTFKNAAKLFFLLPLLSSAGSVLAQTWKQFYDRIDSLYVTGQIRPAYELSLLSQQQAEREFGKTHANYGVSRSTTGQLLQELGDYKQAESLMKEGIYIIEHSNTPDIDDYSYAVTILGGLYTALNRMPESFSYLEKALRIRERLNGKESQKYAETLTLLAVTHLAVGQYEQAITEMQKVLVIRERIYGKEAEPYAEAVGNLASIYIDIDDYIQAEPLLETALSIREKTVGKDNVHYWYSLNNLIALKSRMGDYDQSIVLANDLLARMNKADQQDGLYVSTLGLLSGNYVSTKQYQRADSAYRVNLALVEGLVGKNHIRYSDNLRGLAEVVEQTGRFPEAESLYREAITACQVSIGVETDQYVDCSIQLAELLARSKKYTEADSIYKALKSLSERVLGTYSFGYSAVLNGQLMSYRLQNKATKAIVLLSEANQLNTDVLIRQLPYWSTRQREKYLLKHQPDSWENLSVAADFSGQSGVAGILYEQSLQLKNLLLTQHLGLEQTVRATGNQALLTLFDSLRTIQNSIASQYTLPVAQRKNLDSLEARAETLEKDLARQSAPFRAAQRALQTRWQDVRDDLKPTEAAVEFVSFPYHNGLRQIDSVRYMALVLRPGDTAPQVVPLLADETPLRRLLARKSGVQVGAALYATRGSELDTDQLTKGDSLYQLIWQPLDTLLTNAKTVYLSPSGLLHQVAFAALPYSASKGSQYLADRYQLRQVGSTRQVTTPTLADDTYRSITSATLYGGIQYDSAGVVPAPNPPGAWPFLPGTQHEVTQIGQLIGPKAAQRTGSVATEADFKTQSGKSPSVLHVATHGFAFPDPLVSRTDSLTDQGGAAFRQIANPLFRTGLLMAGANRAWLGGRPAPGEDDGILTAYEVANLNLSNTKLVVLSACETALGDIRGSEGVFGLQRAFKMAGSGYLLTSLWPVSDQTTSDLMAQFYQNWKRYKTIRLAYEKTQQQMRHKYPPSVWAAFVLIE
ncbi:CHAT domain-containing protein [Spirosoma spitsbergense]|uniref:CHAT domain-containing protein n=1 Tax=Spirosoma spitsbergense TaxID=431554 RepID=UPI0003696131|nr:CHAT domain-containing protein [Spirosoma spitsbergense]